MSSPQRITLKNLAQQLGVSTATVSNAFNRPDQLSSSLRTRILDTADRLGYAGPDAKARSLRTGRSSIIGVILAESLIYSFQDAVASEFLAGVAEVLDAHGHTLLLLPGRDHARRQPGAANIADGFIVYGLMPDDQVIAELTEHKPLISVDFDIKHRPAIHIDDASASYLIASHALKRPPRRPAVINLRLTSTPHNGRVEAHHRFLPHTSTISRARLTGFFKALAESGFDTEQVPLWNIEENTHPVCLPVIEDLLSLPPDQRPDLLLCMSDRIALTVLTVAEQAGIKVPDELRITGFDGIPEGQYRAPTLTTVRQNNVMKGRLAARMVLGIEPARQTLLSTELVLGDTCP